MAAANGLFPLDRIEHVPFAPAQAQEADITRLLEHWSSLRQGAPVPRKDALDPAAFGPILPLVAILEQHAPDNYRVRLFATMLSERYGRDATGENYIELVPQALRGRLCQMFADALAAPCVYLVHQKMSGGGKLVLELEYAVLPLSDPGGAARFLLTATRALQGSAGGSAAYSDFAGELVQVEVIAIKRMTLD